MSKFSEAFKAATPTIKDGVKKAWDSDTAKGIRKKATEAAVGIAKDLSVDAAAAASKKAVDVVDRKLGSDASNSVKSSFERNLDKRLERAKSAPLSERTRNEALLQQAAKESQSAKNTATAAKAGGVAMGVGGIVAGVAAAPATGGSSAVAAAIATEVAFEAGAASSGTLAVQQSQKDTDILEEASRITSVPPKNDILLHFGLNTEKYKKFCYMPEKEMGSEKVHKKLLTLITDNFSKIGSKVIENICKLYYGFKDLSIADKALVIATFGYLISPVDMVPDAIPLIGFADDGIVISYVLERVSAMISKEMNDKATALKDSLRKDNKVSAEESRPESTVKTEPADADNLISTENEIPEEIGGIHTIRKF